MEAVALPSTWPTTNVRMQAAQAEREALLKEAQIE